MKKPKGYKQPVGEVNQGYSEFSETTPNLGWFGLTSTSDLHKVRQSINTKTERSEQDVKKSFESLIVPLFLITLLNTVLLIVIVGN